MTRSGARSATNRSEGNKILSKATPRVDAVICAAIVALALSVRLSYLFQIEASPLFYHPVGDGRVYDEWAQRIAAGDWLGEGVFYQAPLYPYFLGILQLLIGHDLWSIRVVQAVLGAISCGLLYWVGRSFFSSGAGIAAGFILALYAPAVFYGGLIQKAVLDLVLLAALLYLLGRVQLRLSWLGWVAAGITLALLCLTRENALIWLLVIPLWIWFYFARHTPRARLAWIGLFLLGAALVLFPVGLRNFMVGGDFTLTTAQLGPNLFIGNNPSADGTYIPLRGGHGDPQFERQDATELAEQDLGRSLSPGEVSSYWVRRSLAYMTAQPLDWLRLMGRKWLILWNVRELEDADDFYLYQKWSWLLRVLSWINYFGVLAPLAAMGIVMTWKQWRKLWLLYLLLVTLAFSTALFYVFGRYRFPMVPLLALFAGAGLTELFVRLKKRALSQLLASGGVLLFSAVLVHWPVFGEAGPSPAAYNNLGNALAKQGRMAEAQESYERALRIEPTDAAAHYNLANLRALQGDLDRAARHYQEAVRISPDFAEAHNNLGNVLLSRGEVGDALLQFRKALEISPNRSEFHYNLAVALARTGDMEEVSVHLQRALKLQPDFPEAHHRLGLVLAAQGQLDKAVDQFRLALRLKPEFAEAHESLGRSLAELGKRDEATGHYQEAVRIMKSRRDAGARE